MCGAKWEGNPLTYCFIFLQGVQKMLKKKLLHFLLCLGFERDNPCRTLAFPFLGPTKGAKQIAKRLFLIFVSHSKPFTNCSRVFMAKMKGNSFANYFFCVRGKKKGSPLTYCLIFFQRPKNLQEQIASLPLFFFGVANQIWKGQPLPDHCLFLSWPHKK